MLQTIFYALGALLLLTAIILAAILYLLIRDQVQSPQYKRKRRSARYSSHQQYNAAQSRLLGLVNGDMPTAERLVASVRSNHPRRPEEWCWEKAAEDLIRDRR